MRATLPPVALALWLTLTGCSNPCVEMCQQADAWLQRCGYGWSTTFEEERWASVDDCYDAWWDSTPEEQRWCAAEAEDYAERSCY